MSVRYEVTHRTTYTYDDDVTDSYGMTCLRPRDLPGQQLLEHTASVEPAPEDRAEHEDADGNHLAYFNVTTPHRRLEVTARSVVDRDVVPPDPERSAVLWEHARPLRPPSGAGPRWAVDGRRAREFAMGSPLVALDDAVHDYAAPSLTAGRPLVEAVLDLASRIHNDFAYRPGVTTVTTGVADVLASRSGVCQDFAHLMLACLRSHGLAARYVSGYLGTDPPEGRDRLVGSVATHAWIECWVPGHGWLAVDPTNDCEAGDRHLTVAWGRDYGDVAPVKGVIFTEASSSEMTVAVDVVPVDQVPG